MIKFIRKCVSSIITIRGKVRSNRRIVKLHKIKIRSNERERSRIEHENE